MKIFRISLLFFIFLCISYSYAQKSENPNKVEQATVVLKDGAKLFSTDEAFNKQISNNVIVLENADLVPQNNSTAKVLEANSSKPIILQKDLKKEVEASAEKKQKEAIKTVDKEIKKHEERKGAFRKFDFTSFPSSSHFLSSNFISKNYLAPSYNENDFSKIQASDKIYSVKSAINYLHALKFTHYNSESLNNHFPSVNSVRPPPLNC
ncbi:hypothetical protein NZ698_13550 [Chryseobacterium sp. PBS4-4]|uniref:Uncharacterized protein n=1 Tax=Chryseobacterium edaphi TaxID=2976532 RepID=A0ABT2W9X0_9FLAO|nr:hypothetical protein [Chryseobacterium edaphi]MCU7618229.1 hypothetical protein [Chryseobacterium edaphi]